MEAVNKQPTSLKHAEEKTEPSVDRSSQQAQPDKPWKEGQVNRARITRNQEYKEEKIVPILDSNERLYMDRIKSPVKLISNEIYNHSNKMSYVDNSVISSSVDETTCVKMQCAKSTRIGSLQYKSDSHKEYTKTASFTGSTSENKDSSNPKYSIYYPWGSKLFRYNNDISSQSSFVDISEGDGKLLFKKIPMRVQEEKNYPVNTPASKSLDKTDPLLDETPSNESSMTINICLATVDDTEPCIPEHVAANLLIQTGAGITLQRTSMLSSKRSSQGAFPSEVVSADSIGSANNSNRSLFHLLFGRSPRVVPKDTERFDRVGSNLKFQRYPGAPKYSNEGQPQSTVESKLNMLKNLADSIIAVEIQAARIKGRRIATQTIGNQTEFAIDQRRYSKSDSDSEGACNEKSISVGKSLEKDERPKKDKKGAPKVRFHSSRSDSCPSAPAVNRELPSIMKSVSTTSSQFESTPPSFDECFDHKPVEQRNAGNFCCIIPNRRAMDLSKHSLQHRSLVCSTLENRSPTLIFPNRIMILNAVQDLGPKASNQTPKTLIYELVSVKSDKMTSKSEERSSLFRPRTSLSTISTSIESFGCLDSLSKMENQVKYTHKLSSAKTSDVDPGENKDMEKSVSNPDVHPEEAKSDSKQNEPYHKLENNFLSTFMDKLTISSESISATRSKQRKANLLISKRISIEEDTLKVSAGKAVAKSRRLRSKGDNQEKQYNMASIPGSGVKELHENKVHVFTRKTKDNEVSKPIDIRKQSFISKLQDIAIEPKDSLSSLSSSSIQALGVEIKANPTWFCQGMCIRTHEALEEQRNFDGNMGTDVNIKFSPASLVSRDHVGNKPIVTIKIDPNDQTEARKLRHGGPISVKLGKKELWP